MSALPPLSDDARHIRDELIAAQPDGGEVLLDWDDPDGPGGETEADARVLDEAGVQVVARLRREIHPQTCVDGLPIWERSLGLLGSKIAQSGTVAQRQEQVVSKLREGGPPTLQRIRDVVNAFLGYADASNIQILEVDRDALRAMHTYWWRGFFSLSAVPTVLTFDVPDDALVAEPGPQVDIGLTITDLATLYVELTAPDGTMAAQGSTSLIGRGSMTSPRAFELLPAAGLTIRGLSPFDGKVWAVGAGGGIAVWDGTSWAAQVSGTVADLYGVAGFTRTILGTTVKALWAVGAGGVILLGNATAGTWAGVLSPVADDLLAVAVASGTSALAVGKNWALASWNGTVWAGVVAPLGAAGDATCCTRIGSLWYVGDSTGNVYSYDGAAWLSLGSVGAPLRGLWGTAGDDLWAVGDGGVAARLGPGGWKNYAAGGGANLTSVWGESSRALYPTRANAVWAVGAGGVIAFWNGSTWSTYASPTASNLYAVTGTADDVFVGGVQAAHLAGGVAQRLRLYFPALAGHAVAGRWTFAVLAGLGSVTDVGLFVEGIGLDSKGGHGRGGVKFKWGVVADPALLGPAADLIAAQEAIDRICYACREGRVLLKGTSAGAIPDTPSATPDLAIPG